MFNSKLRISIFDNLPKKFFLHKTCGFAQIAQKNCAKLKFRFMRNFRKKYFLFCTNCAKTLAQNRAKLIAFHAAKIAQKFAKKNFAKIAQILRKRFSHFVETLSGKVRNTVELGGNYRAENSAPVKSPWKP